MPARFALFSLLAVLGLTHPAPAQAQVSTDAPAGSLRWFPTDHLFPRLFADGTAEQMSLTKDMQTRRWIGSIGGVQRIVQWESDSLKFQLGAGATLYASLIRRPSVLQVVTADFYVDFPFEIQLSEELLLRTGWGHHSAHLVDDGIELLGLHSINYAKDYVPLLAGVRIPEIGGLAYGGTEIDYYSLPERSSHWVLQGGIQGSFLPFSAPAELYAAIDVKVKSESAWGTTQSYQLGLKTPQSAAVALRVAYTYRTGLDDRGQFYRQHIAVSSLGIYFDF